MWVLAAMIACTGTGTIELRSPRAPEPEPPQRVGDALVQFPDGQAPRNVLMISIDTLRKDAIGRYGGGTDTPFLDGWLTEAVVADDHQQCSNWTFASTSCTLNGTTHEQNGFMPKLGLELREALPDGQRTIATELRDAGFHTVLVSTNEWLSAAWGNAQGYVETPFYGYGNGTYLTDKALEDLQERIDLDIVDRWFLHVHWVEPHAPYTPPVSYRAPLADLDPIPWDLDTQEGHYDATGGWPEMTEDERALLTEHLTTRYAGEVQWLDDQLEDLVQRLGDDGWLDDTLVVLWTDHGEQFWEHGFQSHAHTLSSEENDGLLALWAPGLPAEAWSGRTHGIDLMPTLLEGLQVQSTAELEGVPVGTAPALRPTFTVSSARQGPVQAITQDGFKLQFRWYGGVTLYDRTIDPAETHDLYRSDHPRVPGLWSALTPRILALEPLVPEHTLSWPTDLPRPP